MERRILLAGVPIISEFVADNTGYPDGDGKGSDWVEIYNSGDSAIDLAGWHLTDNASDRAKWAFPHRILDRGEYLVVFASGEAVDDYVDPAGYLHTNFKIDADGGYLALTRPDLSVASEFAAYPKQRQNIAYGLTQEVTNTTLIGAGDAAKVLIPTAADGAAIGSTWTGGGAFNDSGWQSVQLGVGYGANAGDTIEVLKNVALSRPATTNGTLYAGMTAARLTNGNRGDVVHGDGPGGNAGVHEAAGFKYEINLGSSYNLDHIDVFPRQDGCCPTRLTKYRVSVHLDDNGSIGAAVWTADMRANGSFPAAGPTPPDTLGAALNAAGTFAGQWIRITSLENPVPNYSLQLGEVEVYSLVSVPANEQNLALNAPVTASGPLWPGFPIPGNITDGSRSTFTHPATPVTAFDYTIDLGASHSIDHINVVNRGDGCCPERLSNYRVTVFKSDDGEFGPAVWTADVRTDGSNSGPSGVDLLTADLDPAGTFEGRFVRIERINDGAADYWPQIAEVEIFAPNGYGTTITTDIEGSMKNVNASAYLRTKVQVADASAYDSLKLRIKDDDGFVAYLNGVEIARRNAPAGTPAFDAASTASHFAGSFSEFTVPISLLHNGENVLAVHGLNLAAGDNDFLILPELRVRATTSGSAGYLTTPTPAGPNGTSVAGFVADTVFDINRGFFDAPFDVHITTATPGATILYTTDGSAPTLLNGIPAFPSDALTPPTATVSVSTTTTLRAAAFLNGYEPTNVDTNTYIFLNDVIHQPASPAGYPGSWNGYPADYEMDPDVVNNPAYANEIVAGLRSIPTMSLVMDPKDFLGPTNGIYTFPEQIGDAWERPVSVEMINPDGTSFFQENAGIRVWGTGWRPHSSTPKHAFQLKFKEQYGPPKLDHQLFPDSPVSKFDDIVLRAQGSRSWLDFREGALEREATQYIHDAWARDTALAMGKLDGHSTYVQLYINGLYWGLYNPVEKPAGSFGEEYLGGEIGDFDVISHRVGEPIVANEGDLVAWNQMMALADAGLSSSAAYAQIQQLVDVDNLIDYMLVNAYATNHDGPASGNNMRVLRKREPGGQFRFFFWDMEYTFWNVTEATGITNVDVAGTIGHLFTKLRDNVDFRQRFSDHAHAALTGNGALTPARAAARWQARADEIHSAILGESARWGDYRRPNQPYTRNVEWTNELNRLMTQYFPVRAQILIDQLKTAGLYVEMPTPSLSQNGGTVPAGFNVTITAPTVPTLVDKTVLASGAAVRALVPTSGALLQTWTQVGFDDSTWSLGTSGVGYDNQAAGTNFNPLIGLDIGLATPSTNEPVSVYTRIKFNLDDISTFSKLTLRMKYDDGYVAYINGFEVARKLAPGVAGTPPAFNATATSQRPDTLSVVFEDVDITAQINKLVAGTNVLAIHGLNQFAASPDFLVLPELVTRTLDASPPAIYYTLDGSDPRASGGGVNPGAHLYNGPVVISQSALLTSRALLNNNWSVPVSALFTVTLPLRVSEIMYNPAGSPNAEFIELVNPGTGPLDLTGVKLVNGVEFTFGNVMLPPGERVVLARSLPAFAAAYGPAIVPAGVYTGSLDNGGETITLHDAAGGLIQTFAYDDEGKWPGRADGGGSSLEVLNTAGDYNDPANWRASYEYGGTPGTVGVGAQNDVVVNEVLTNTLLPAVDAIELHNTTPGDIDISGWYLSDSNNNYRKYRIPDNTTLPAGGYAVFDEHDFNPTPLTPGPDDFALDGAHGDDVWLLKSALDGTLLAFADHVEFEAAAEGESIGRWPNGTGRFYPMASVTLDAANSGPRIGPVIVSELMYHPPTGNADLEYIELLNVTDSPADLAGWRMDRGVDFTFPAGSILPAHEPLVLVDFDPASPADAPKLANFRTVYAIDATITLVGPYVGLLSDTGEALRLVRPDAPPPTDPLFTPYLTVEQIDYSSSAPWPTSPAGTGPTLGRLSDDVYADDPADWAAQPANPGSIPFGHALFQAGINYTYATATTLDSLTIRAASRVNMAAGGDHPLVIGGISIDSASTLNLFDNDLALLSTPGNSAGNLATITALITSGRNSGVGKWTGHGIRSSTAAGQAAGLNGLAALRNDKGAGVALHQTFAGRAVGVNDILIKYTWNGDADLTGKIDANDYFKIDSGFAAGATGYGNGDFDYSGHVDANDYFLIDSAFAGQTGVLSGGPPAAVSNLSRRRTRRIHHHQLRLAMSAFL